MCNRFASLYDEHDVLPLHAVLSASSDEETEKERSQS